jgi:hypothetical protein
MAIINDKILNILASGEIEVKGEFVWGSNYTFLADIIHQEEKLPVVYKPSEGERPLWDFPPASLAKREVAAYLVSEALGWNLVPPTVYRDDAPLGAGSVQLFIDHDPNYHYFVLTEEDRQKLRPVVLFDCVINNGDRKGGHIISGPDGHLWFIDHGVSFHVDDKLRTVIWDFIGEIIPEELYEDISRLRDQLAPQDIRRTSLIDSLGKYLDSAEVEAVRNRAIILLESGLFPAPDPHRRHYPWPQL